MLFSPTMVAAEHIQLRQGYLSVAETPERFPLGARGQRPCRFQLNAEMTTKIRELRIPGVTGRGNRFECTWDAATIVAEQIGEEDAIQEALNYRLTCPVPMQGFEKYKQTKMATLRRDYQAESAKFILRRAYSLLAEVPRAGKCVMVLMACSLLDVKKVMILANALGKPVWAQEIAFWLGESALMMYGRSCSEARELCVECTGKGVVDDSDGDVDEYGVRESKRCSVCRGIGEKIHLVRDLEVVTEPKVYFVDTGKLKKDGTPKMQRRVSREAILPLCYSCIRHKDVVSEQPGKCPTCRKEMSEVIARARFCILNYDIITAQQDKTDRGVSFVRADLTGWGSELAKHKFDIAVLSEGHKLRGLAIGGGEAKKTQHRVERVYEVVSEIPQIIEETGTAIVSGPKDLSSQLTILSKGLW